MKTKQLSVLITLEGETVQDSDLARIHSALRAEFLRENVTITTRPLDSTETEKLQLG
jgi:hypothetical protein